MLNGEIIGKHEFPKSNKHIVSSSKDNVTYFQCDNFILLLKIYCFGRTELFTRFTGPFFKVGTVGCIKDRVIRDCYDKHSYRRVIVRACKKAGIESWTPYQLRHSAATIIRKKYGIEAARVVLGHKNLSTTEIYAEADRESAIEAMKEIG